MGSDESVSILLVDDSDFDAELTIQILRRGKPAAKVTRVHDGVEALEFVFREGNYRDREGGMPTLILLDLKMPRASGIDVLQTLKSDDATKAIPVLVLTGLANESHRLDTKQLGASGYLMKPISLSDLHPWLDK
jgi:two-component system, response regulator